MTLLDTHVLLWWVNDLGKLSAKAGVRIEKEVKSRQVLVSSISVWEIYLLVEKKRLKFRMDVDTWMEMVEKSGIFQFVPIDNTIAAKSVMLPAPFHSDPADRMIVATAREYGATVITSDERIRKYPQVQSLW